MRKGWAPIAWSRDAYGGGRGLEKGLRVEKERNEGKQGQGRSRVQGELRIMT
jgi:hypothetical protein